MRGNLGGLQSVLFLTLTVQLVIFGRHTKHDQRKAEYASNNDLSKLRIE